MGVMKMMYDKKVLIVEDNPELGSMMGMILKGQCYEPILHKQYEDTHVRDVSYHAYMLDFDNNFGMSGLEFIQENGVHIPVYKRILMSGGESWKDSGIQGKLLSKPFKIDTLIGLLEDIRKYE